MFTFNPNHEPARSMFHQGSMILSRPSMGSWISYGLGTENKNLPAFMVLAPDGGGFTTAGFLPAEYQGTSFNTFETEPDKMIRFLRNDTLTTDAQRAQLDLTQALNQQHASAFGQDAFLDGRIESMEAAFKMQFAAMDTFDVRQEPESVREEYGSTPVRARVSDGAAPGRARRPLCRRPLRAGPALGRSQEDRREPARPLPEHGSGLGRADPRSEAARLLDETLVVWGGEFGRTPVSESGDGRDHNPYGFTMFMAGGGVKGGMTYGATDEFGFKAVENRVSIHDLHATILNQLGIDHEKLTYRYAGRDFRLTDVFGTVVKDILV